MNKSKNYSKRSQTDAFAYIRQEGFTARYKFIHVMLHVRQHVGEHIPQQSPVYDIAALAARDLWHTFLCLLP